MASNNNKTNEFGSDQDDDPTVELEILSEAVGAESETHRGVESESDQHTSGFAELNNKFSDADEAVSKLESNLNSHVEANGELQFEVELLRSKWNGLEKEVKVLEEAMGNISNELTVAQEKQLHANELLKKRDNEIESLRSQLLLKEQDIEELSKCNVPTGSRSSATSASTHRVGSNDEPHEFAMLLPLNGNGLGEYPVKTGLLMLGSSPDNDIQIQSEFISRHHAQIISSASDSILGDLNSTNGTYVNSKRIKRHALRNGDLITIGKHRFRFVRPNLDTSDHKLTFNEVRVR